MKYNKEWLLKTCSKGHEIAYLFFWGHQPSKDGRVTSSCFSQWWPATFTVDGRDYATAEHWMMAGKAKLFGDEEILHRICEAPSPAQAKKLGRQVKGFDPAIWDQHKYEIVRTGNLHKFGQHKDLADFLLDTQARVLVEASPVDPVWGIGLAAGNPRCGDPAQWQGHNLLGFALMEVRDAISLKEPL